jgi:uncharacterized protein (TIGR02246 family)
MGPMQLGTIACSPTALAAVVIGRRLFDLGSLDAAQASPRVGRLVRRVVLTHPDGAVDEGPVTTVAERRLTVVTTPEERTAVSHHDTATDPAHLMSLFSQRAAAGDADGLVALYEPDAVFEPQLGTVLRGLEEIRPALVQLAALTPRIEYTGEPDVVIVDGVAIVANSWTMTAPLPDGTTHREEGLSADVLRRQPDGRWLILIDQPRGERVGDELATG